MPGWHLCVSRFFLCIALALSWNPYVLAHDYYVSTNGSDANPGTIDQPFRTIQKAASVMVAGDTTLVRAGTYRETVTPVRSGTPTAPITFQPYNGESVTISGAEVIPENSWTISSGNIWQAPVSWDLGEGNNQIFIDGKMMIEARWPNTSLDVSHPSVAHWSTASYVEGNPDYTGAMNDPALPPRPGDYWKGATIHFNPLNWPDSHGQTAGWNWQTGTVVGSAASQLSFTFKPLNPPLAMPGPMNPYFLTGKLSELDSAGEWYFDNAASTLYVWSPSSDSPAQHLVEAKRRQFAFNLSNRSFIVVQGFNLFAASITSNFDSAYLLLDRLDVQYVSHYSLLNGGGPDAAYAGIKPIYPDGTCCAGSGIVLVGSNNVLRNSTIAFSAGNGVSVMGDSPRIFNNVIHDVDYAGSAAAPIALSFYVPEVNRFLLAWNTLYNSGDSGIYHGLFSSKSGNGRVLHNHIYNYGLEVGSSSCNYVWQVDGQETEIAYNLCHDSIPPYGGGFNFDHAANHFVVHHNVIWNSLTSLGLRDGSTASRIYNNTFASYGDVLGFPVTLTLPGIELKNNIFTANLQQPVGAILQNNLLSGTDPQFVDPTHGNFQLKPTSPAIGAGVAIPPYTDGFTGKAPDIGAYDHGLSPWTAGAQGSAVVSSGTLTPGTTATITGLNFTAGTASASSAALPLSLLGVTVTITDGANNDVQARLVSVSPTQVVFQVPSGLAPGIALITITSGNGAVSVGSAPVFATYYFPHLAVGGGWQTTLTYVNSASEKVSCDSKFFSDDGTPLIMPFNGSAASTRTDILSPGASLHVETRANAVGSVSTGWAAAYCTGLIKASLLFRSYDRGVPVGEAGVNAMPVPAASFTTFAETQTGIALANPSGQPTTVTITAIDLTGQVVASHDLTLSPGQHSAAFVGSLLGLSSFTGSVRITSSTPIITLSLNFEAAPVFSSLPPGELYDPSDLSAKTYRFAHLAVGGGWQTTITYVNYGAQTVSCQTTFFSDSGGPLLLSFGGTAASARTDAMGPGATIHLQTQASAEASLATGWASTQCSGPVKASLLFRSYHGVPTGEAGVNAMSAPATSFNTFAETQTGIAYANPSARAATVTITALNLFGQVLGSRDLTLAPGEHGAAFVGPLLGLSSFTGSVRITSSTPIVSLSLNFEAAPVFSSLPPGQ